MYIVFAWKQFEALGGVGDLLDSFETIDDAEEFCEQLQNSDPSFEYQITNSMLEVVSESGTEGNPFLTSVKYVAN